MKFQLICFVTFNFIHQMVTKNRRKNYVVLEYHWRFILLAFNHTYMHSSDFNLQIT